MSIHKNIQIFQLVNLTHSIHLKELRKTTDIVILLMHKLDHRKNGHKESTPMLILKNIQISQLENLILSIPQKELRKTTDTVTHLMHKYFLNLNL
jgi:hypothetical protein